MHSLETGRKLVYYNQQASMNAASDFLPDSRHLLIYSTANGGFSQIYGPIWTAATCTASLTPGRFGSGA